MQYELQRYGRNKNTLINSTYISSGIYRRKFDQATDNRDVNRALYQCAKNALSHRSGTELEDMFWLDHDTGKIVYQVDDSTENRAIIYPNKLQETLRCKPNLITIHSHPGSMPPSIEDFNSAFHNNYRYCFVACHDGKLFKYTSKEEIHNKLYELYVQQYKSKGLSDFDAQIKALEELSRNHDIYFTELISETQSRNTILTTGLFLPDRKQNVNSKMKTKGSVFQK